MEILDILENILDAIMTFFGWVGSLIDGLVNLVVQVCKAIAAIPNYIGWLPSSVVAILVVGFGVVAAYKILGREG